MCTAAAPRGLTGHITQRYKLSIRNQMSERPWGGFLGAFLWREHAHTLIHTLQKLYVKCWVNKNIWKAANVHRYIHVRTHTNKPTHVGFHGWLLGDNERSSSSVYCLLFEVISVNTRDIHYYFINASRILKLLFRQKKNKKRMDLMSAKTRRVCVLFVTSSGKAPSFH